MGLSSLPPMPTAACALVIHETGLILSVSRRDDPDALGLPGGKIERREGARDAAARELQEETGLVCQKLFPVFEAMCEGGPGGVDHLTMAFLCRARGRISTQESGRVLWVPRSVLCEPPSPFARYNVALFDTFDLLTHFDMEGFITMIPLDPAHVLKRALHGAKTHQLSEFAREQLRRIAAAPIPRQELNPGVADRLLRGLLVVEVAMPSPYKTRSGSVPHLQITDAGRALLGGRL